MRTFLFKILSLFILTQSGFAQKQIFTYKYEFQKFESRPEYRVTGEALLLNGSTLLQFIDKGKYNMDSPSLNKNLTALEAIAKLKDANINFNYSILTDKNTDSLKYFDRIHQTTFHYQEASPNIDWEILEDTTRILDYLCQKAVGQYAGRTYEAWFSAEIPLSYGPYKFGGLPGLIFKISDSDKKINYILIGIEPVDNVKIINYTQKNPLSKNDYKTRREHYYTNQEMYAFQGATRNITENGKPISMKEFYEGLKQEYLDAVQIEKD